MTTLSDIFEKRMLRPDTRPAMQQNPEELQTMRQALHESLCTEIEVLNGIFAEIITYGGPKPHFSLEGNASHMILCYEGSISHRKRDLAHITLDAEYLKSGDVFIQVVDKISVDTGLVKACGSFTLAEADAIKEIIGDLMLNQLREFESRAVYAYFHSQNSEKAPGPAPEQR